MMVHPTGTGRPSAPAGTRCVLGACSPQGHRQANRYPQNRRHQQGNRKRDGSGDRDKGAVGVDTSVAPLHDSAGDPAQQRSTASRTQAFAPDAGCRRGADQGLGPSRLLFVGRASEIKQAGPKAGGNYLGSPGHALVIGRSSPWRQRVTGTKFDRVLTILSRFQGVLVTSNMLP